MSLTVLADVIAPNSLWSSGVRGTWTRVNARAQNQGGRKQINIVRSRTLRQFDFTTVPMNPETFATLQGLYEATDAGAYGFLVKDPSDGGASHSNGIVSLISAPAHTYQLYKRYVSAGSARTRDRKITRPIPTDFQLKSAGSVVSGGSYTLDEETGILTIPSDPAASSLTWSSRYYVPVHFENDDIDWDLDVAGPEESRFMSGKRLMLTEILE